MKFYAVSAIFQSGDYYLNVIIFEINLKHVETLVLIQRWANVSTPTMTRCQQPQPLLNVGRTLARYIRDVS